MKVNFIYKAQTHKSVFSLTYLELICYIIWIFHGNCMQWSLLRWSDTLICSFLIFFFFNLQNGVRMSPLGRLATTRSTVPALDDDEDDRRVWNRWWNKSWEGKPMYSAETCPCAILSPPNPIWRDMGPNPGCCSGKLTTNCLSFVKDLIWN
jgi:hypothetical protein